MLETAATTGDGRIVFTSSKAHEFASWDPENMNTPDEQHYDRLRVYGVTKLYNVSCLSLPKLYGISPLSLTHTHTHTHTHERSNAA